jgi:hypothetical protein
VQRWIFEVGGALGAIFALPLGWLIVVLGGKGETVRYLSNLEMGSFDMRARLEPWLWSGARLIWAWRVR